MSNASQHLVSADAEMNREWIIQMGTFVGTAFALLTFSKAVFEPAWLASLPFAILLATIFSVAWGATYLVTHFWLGENT